jgi:hypothetical protein
MATSRILDNGLNVKDDTRLANATQKLTGSAFADQYTFNTSVQPVMIAGIEENPTLSTVDLITCIRDQNGVNRLCVDNRGIAVPSKEQIIVNVGLVATNFTLDYDTLASGVTTNFPYGKTIYLSNWVFTNQSGDATPHNFDLQFNSNPILNLCVPTHSSIIVPMLLAFNVGDILQLGNDGVTPGGDTLSLNGVIQI